MSPRSHQFASAAPSSHAFDADGIRLVVHDWGGSGPPLLLAHATGFHGRIWAPIASLLTHAGRHVYSFDFRGHGDSDAPDVESDSYAWREFAADALAVTRHLGFVGDDDLLACGHSMGGAALLLGEASAPGTYRRVWVYEPIMVKHTGRAAPEEYAPLAAGARRRRDRWPSREAAYDAYSTKPPLDVMRPDSLRAYVDYGLRQRADGEFALKCRPEVEARIYTTGSQHDAFARLPDIEPPVHVVCGEATTAITPKFGSLIAQRLPDAALEVLDGCGHFGPQADPERAAASMLQFARRA